MLKTPVFRESSAAPGELAGEQLSSKHDTPYGKNGTPWRKQRCCDGAMNRTMMTSGFKVRRRGGGWRIHVTPSRNAEACFAASSEMQLPRTSRIAAN